MMDLTVSIINTNNRFLLEPFLASIFAHTQGISYEVYVVDNASTDGSTERVREKFPQVHLLCNERRKGFSSNHNEVLRRGQGRYLILLNEDMLLVNDALSRMVAFMDAHPEAGAVGCRLLNPDGSLQRSCWVGFPSPRTLSMETFYLFRLFPRSSWVQRFEATLRNPQHALEVDHVLGACMMVRREVMERLGALDESFFIFLEETDWCYRIKEDGWKIYWIPDGQIIHYGQQTISKDPQRFLPMLYRNYCKFCRKQGRTKGEIVTLKGIIALGASLRWALWAYRNAKGHPNGRAMMRGYLRTLYEIPSL